MSSEAWAELRDFVAARGLALSRTAFLLTGSEAAAEDLVQDTYVDVVRRWRRIDHSNPELYVRRIMYSRFVDGLRRRRLRDWAFTTGDVERLPSASSPGPEAGVVDRLTFERALQLLTPRQRAVLVLRYYEDLTEAQIAEAMKVSRNTVKSQTRLALRRLKELVPDLAPSVSALPKEVGDMSDLLRERFQQMVMPVEALGDIDQAITKGVRQRNRTVAAAIAIGIAAVVVLPTIFSSPLRDAAPEPLQLPTPTPTLGADVNGWPTTEHNAPGVYSLDNKMCGSRSKGGYCGVGWMHNGYGSGDVQIWMKVRSEAGAVADVDQGSNSLDTGIPVVVTGYDGIL